MNNASPPFLCASLLLALTGLAPAHAAVDARAAQALMKSEQCGTCHSVDRDKAGPSLKTIAARYKGRAESEAAVIEGITSGKVRLPDGTPLEHPVIRTRDAAALKNLAQWILSH